MSIKNRMDYKVELIKQKMELEKELREQVIDPANQLYDKQKMELEIADLESEIVKLSLLVKNE